MLYSQAEVLRQAMIDLGLGTDPDITPLQAWPIYADGEPPSPDQCITVFSTGGKVDARIMVDGTSVQRPGVQIRVRSTDSRTGRSIIENILLMLSKQLYKLNVTVGTGLSSTDYFIQCLTDFGNIIALGKEVPHTRRSIFTLNAMIVFTYESDEMKPIATVNGIALTVAGLTSLYTVPPGKTFIGTGYTVRPTAQNTPSGTATYTIRRLSDGSGVCVGGSDAGEGVGQSVQVNNNGTGSFVSNVEAGDTAQFSVGAPDTGVQNIVSVDLFGYLV